MKISQFIFALIKTISRKFRFPVPKILELFALEICKLLKSSLIFCYSTVSECLKTNISHISPTHISKSKRCFNVKPSSYYFHMKTKILTDFQICISVNFKFFKRSRIFESQLKSVLKAIVNLFSYEEAFFFSDKAFRICSFRWKKNLFKFFLNLFI